MTLTTVHTNPKEGHMAHKHSVRDVDRVVVFTGEPIVDLTWNPKTSGHTRLTRWTDMVLYEVTQDSPVKFMLQVVGRSLVYHREDGCRKGVGITVGRLLKNDERYEELVACRDCRPKDLDFLKADVTVNVEEDRFQLHRCYDTEDVINALRDNRTGIISGLGQKLLSNAASAHAEFRKAMTKEEHL